MIATGNIGQWQGMNSGIDPEFLQSNVPFQAMNTVSRGGVVRTRPGFKSIYNTPNGWQQGCEFFTTTDGTSFFVFAVNGYVYASQYPFNSYYALPNVRFSERSLFVNFLVCEQTTSYDDEGNFVFLARPKKILIMQDGNTPAAYWDGSESRHLNPEKSTTGVTVPFRDETPLGLWMAWVSDRLWVFRDNQGFASDIGNPLKFTETQYLSEARAFLFPGNVTGAVQPYAGSPLVVFTDNTLTQLQAQIRDRSKWVDTPDFQVTEYNLGCVAGKSIVRSFGETWWFSEYGVVNLNFALQTQNDSKFRYLDNQMAVSKAYLSPTLNRVCAASYENYILMSVPSGHIYNEHTWVLDQLNTPDGGATWDGYWTGIRPVDWAVANINGEQRIFALSNDSDGVGRIWEAFDPSRTDNGCPIRCMVETPRYNNGNKNNKKYSHSRVFADGIDGEVYLDISVASPHGPYNSVFNNRLVASRGSVADNNLGEFIDFVPQNRTFTTRRVTDSVKDCNTCGVESKDPSDTGVAFSHRFIWEGNMGISGVQLFMEDNTPTTFEPDCFEDEDPEKIVTSAGCGTTSRSDLPNPDLTYESTKTAEATCARNNTITATATATRKSYVSQLGADAIAECAADVEATANLEGCPNV